MHINQSAITVSKWGKAYIGRYKPPKEDNYGVVAGNYSLKSKDGIFEFEDTNSTEPKQKYLNIRYEGKRIKIRNTLPGTRFDVFNGPL